MCAKIVLTIGDDSVVGEIDSTISVILLKEMVNVMVDELLMRDTNKGEV